MIPLIFASQRGCDKLKKGSGVFSVESVFSFYVIKALDLPYGMAFAVPNLCLSYRNEPISKELNWTVTFQSLDS